jgi:hypothetical protein
MPGLGIKRVLQATPVGYLAEMEDGSQVTFPEHVMVEAGYVQPTQGLYRQPPVQQAQFAGSDERVAPITERFETDLSQPAAPAPAAPSAPAPGTSQRSGYRVGGSTEEFVRRNDVTAAPAPLDLSSQRQALGQANTDLNQSYADQQSQLTAKADAERQRDEVKFGKFDPQTGELLQEGGAQQQIAQREADMAARAEFDAVTQEYVQKRTAEINERIARVPQEDPTKLWGDNNAFQNAAGLLAAGLGGMLAVSTGSGRNLALESIERSIDRNIAAQRTNIENEWRKVAHDKDTLQQYQQWKGRERQWMLEEQVVRLETLALDTEAKASTFSSAARQAEYMGQAAALRGLQAEKSAELIEAEAEYATAESNSKHKLWFDTEQLALEKRRTAAQVAENYAQAAAANRANQPKPADANPPIYRFANGDELYLDPRHTAKMNDKDWSEYTTAAQKKDTFVTEYDSLIRDIAHMGRQNLIATGKRGLSTPELNAVKGRFKTLALDHVNELAATTFTDRLVTTIESMMGGPTGLTDVDKIPAMLEFKKMALNEADAKFRGKNAFIVKAPKEVEPPGGIGPKSGDVSRDVEPYSATKRYGADPRVKADGQKAGEAAKGMLADVLHGSDTRSQLNSLEGLAEYTVSPVGSGPEHLSVLLAGGADVKRDGKVGLANTGKPVGPGWQADAVNRLVLAGVRIKARHPDDPDIHEAVDSRIKELVNAMTTVPKDPPDPNQAAIEEGREFYGTPSFQ